MRYTPARSFPLEVSLMPRASIAARFAVLIASAMLICGCAGLGFNPQRMPVAAELPAGRIVVPIEVVHNIPLVEAQVNGRGPCVFLIDTGAYCFIIDKETAREADLEVETRFGTHVTGAGSTFGAMSLARAGTLDLGGGAAVFTDFEGLATDLGRIREVLGRPVHGIIGIPFMHEFTWTIDYSGRRLVLERDRALSTDEAGVMPFVFSDSTPAITAMIDDEPISVEIDTGGSGGLQLSRADAARVVFSVQPIAKETSMTLTGRAEKRIGRLAGMVRIGPIVLEQPEVYVGHNTTIGGAILRDYALTIDRGRMLIRLAPGERASAEGPAEGSEP
jgi:predicted aspartyl protease